jgi:hypothetical protein
MKTCNVCLKTKSYDNFHWNHSSKDNHANMCKKCQLEYHKHRREKIREAKGYKRKQHEKFHYIRRPHHILPPDPDHAVKIEKGPITLVFD